MILKTKVHFEELAVSGRREDIMPETVHDARTTILTKEKDKYIAQKKSQMTKKMLMK